MIMIYVYLFIIGACFTSFIDVIAYRLPKSESFIKGRSYCEHCHHQLYWFELIPIFSYVFLKGRCYHCQNHVTIKHLFIECLGGMLAILSFCSFGLSIQTIVVFCICLDLLLIAIIDQQTMDIYLSTIIILLLLVIVFKYLQGFQWTDVIIGALLISLLLMILVFIIPDSFGLGDIELVFVSGIMLGWFYNLLAVVISVLVANIYVSYLLLIKKVDRKTHIAFGPYLVFGILLSLFFGTKICSWYFMTFFC